MWCVLKNCKKYFIPRFKILKPFRITSVTTKTKRYYKILFKLYNLSGHILYTFLYVLVIARFRVQYGQYFFRFSYFADLFHEPLGE